MVRGRQRARLRGPSVRCTTPLRRAASGVRVQPSSPSRRRVPVEERSPESASTSSACPFPSTPATPRISPRATVKVAPRRPPPRCPRHCRSMHSRRGGPGEGSRAGAAGIAAEPPITAAANSTALTLETPLSSTMRPRRRTVTRSATARTSPSLCEMKRTPRPDRASSRIVRSSSAISAGARSEVGSSRMSTRAPRQSCFTISTRCCAAAPSVSTGASTSSGSPARSAAARISRRARSASRTPKRRGSRPSTTFSQARSGGTRRKC